MLATQVMEQPQPRHPDCALSESSVKVRCHKTNDSSCGKPDKLFVLNVQQIHMSFTSTSFQEELATSLVL
jgi:hypothetical protein